MSPGFTIARAVITTSIYEDGKVVVEREQFFSGRGDVEYTKTETSISKGQLNEIVSLVNSGNFFEITEADAAQCIADAPSKALEISLDGNYNKVVGIGMQCNPETVAAAQQIIDKIETTLGDKNCPAGYSYVMVPHETKTPQYYCKINKEWNEFESCSNSIACTDGYQCTSRDDGNADFRCIPSSSYQMACGCNPDEDNMPQCWCS